MAQRWKFNIRLTNSLISRIGKDRLNCFKCGESLLKEEKITSHLRGYYCKAVYYHNRCAKKLWV